MELILQQRALGPSPPDSPTGARARPTTLTRAKTRRRAPRQVSMARPAARSTRLPKLSKPLNRPNPRSSTSRGPERAASKGNSHSRKRRPWKYSKRMRSSSSTHQWRASAALLFPRTPVIISGRTTCRSAWGASSLLLSGEGPAARKARRPALVVIAVGQQGKGASKNGPGRARTVSRCWRLQSSEERRHRP